MKNIARAVCVALTLMMLLIPALSLRARAEGPSSDLRYGTGDERDTVLSADRLFAYLFPEQPPLTAAERAYFGENRAFSLRYRSDIPDSIIETVYNGDEGLLTVTVPAYSYRAENGKEVVWVPKTVCMDGEDPLDLMFDEQIEAYTAVYRDVWHSETFDLTVTFVFQTQISADVSDALLTGAATVAVEALAARRAYETAKADYDERLAAYEDYAAAKADYDERKAAYDDYTVAKADYDERLAAYDDYTVAKAAYDAARNAYEQERERKEAYEQALTAYYAYEAQRQQNAALYDRYEAYLNAMERIESRLAVLESMFVQDSHGWVFYNSLMGGTVDGVLERRSELKSMRVSAENIDGAKEATDALRELMKNYNDLRKDSYSTELEKTTALFGYYTEHYAELRDQVAKLFDHINAIYSHGAVQTVMESNPQTKEKVPRFRQFLAQLYVLKCCLNDIETLDFSWTIPMDSEPLSSLVDEPLLLTDNNQADPAGLTVPTEEISLGDSFSEPVEKPKKDFIAVEDPGLEPEAVADPGDAPSEVADPGDEPTVVEAPNGEPPILTLTQTELSLASELENGVLPSRSPFGVAQPLILSRDVTAQRSVQNRKTVTFYDWNGEPISVREVDFGAEITDPPTVERADDAYFYKLLGWIPYGSNEETPIGLAGIESNLSLAPLFSRRAKVYTVKWVFEGRPEQTAETTWKYGETPVCPIDPVWEGDAAQTHTFLGWDRKIEPVTANATYTARYESTAAVYTVTWDLGDRTETERLPYDATPVYNGLPTRATDENFYEFRGWSSAIGRVKGNATYTAVWRATPLIANAAGNACRAEHTETTVTVYPETDVFDLTVASNYARNSGKTLLLRRGDLTLSFTPEELKRLSDALCAKLEFLLEPSDTEEGVKFCINCRNSIGEALKTDLSFRVTVRYPAAEGLYTMAYRVDRDGTRTVLDMTRYAGGRSTCTVKAGDAVICRPEYLLQYVDETENCNPTLLPVRAAKGAAVSLLTDCAYGYEISGATLVFASGRTEEVGVAFSMPAERVRVLLHVTQITYHITFVADGKIISEQTRLFGEEVAVPADPEKEDSEAYRYLFAGWSPYVTRATGDDRDPIYTASFSETPLSSNEMFVDGKIFFRSPLFFAAVGVVLSAVAAVVLIVFRKKIFRKKRKTVDFGRAA